MKTRENRSAPRLCRGIAKALFLSAVCLGASPAMAAYPDHVIKSVVPFDVGGGTDIFARIMSPYLSQAFGQTVIVENKPGAGAVIGIREITDAKPDGYTILFSSTASTESPALYTHLPFDPFTDIQPVAELAEGPYMIAVTASKVPSTTLADFISYVRQNPGKLNASAGGVGTRLTVELFRLMNNLQLETITYKSAGDAATAMLTGESDLMITSVSPIVPSISAGKVRPLAVTGATRMKEYPDVPTTREAGLPDFNDRALTGVYVRAGTPPEIVAKLHDTLNEIISRPDVIEKFRAQGWEPTPKSTAQFADLYRSEILKWKDVVAKAKIAPLN